MPIHDAAHEWQGYIPFDDMPNAFDPPSGFLATANSRVTYRQIALSAHRLNGPTPTAPSASTSRCKAATSSARRHARRPDRHLQRGGPGDSAIALPTPSTTPPNADDQLRKAADLMRSWDGHLTTDSAAASLVTQTRYALWPLLLEPKLGKDVPNDYHWSESNFAEEEIVMHASPDWLPPGYKDWDACSPTPCAAA